MSSELITLLEKEASSEIDRILGEARAQADKVVAEAKQQAQEYLTTQRRQLESERETAKVRALSAAQVQATALVLQAKDETIAEAFSAAGEELARLQQDKARYGPILRGLVKEASGALSGRVTVEASPRDLDLVKQAVKDLKLDAEVKAADDISGGVRLISDDGRFIVENTLTSRVERVKTLLAPEIAVLVWG